MLQTCRKHYLCKYHKAIISLYPLRYLSVHPILGCLIVLLLILSPLSRASEKDPIETRNEQQIVFDELYKGIDTGDVEIDSLEDRDEYLESLQAALPEGDDVRRRQYEFYVCVTGYGFEFNQAIEVAESYIKQAQQAGDKEAEARFYYCLAEYEAASALWKDSIDSINQSIKVSQSIEHKEYWAWGLAFRCSIRSLVGEFANSLVDCLKARELYGEANKEATGDELLFDIGIAYRRIGFYDKALEYFDEMEALATEEGLLVGRVQTAIQKSFVYYDQEDYTRALQLQKKALALSEQDEYSAQSASARVAVATSLNKLQRFSEAKEELELAQSLLEEFGLTRSNEMIEMQMGIALDGLELHTLAKQHFERAEQLMKAGGNRRYLSMLYEARANNHQLLGDEKAALQAMQKHMALSRALEKDREQQQILILRYQFDSERSELENKKLLAEKKLQETEVEALKRAQHWQMIAIIMGGLLTLVLLFLIVRQLGLSRRLKRQALTDSLTGVANRRYIEDYCQTILQQAKREQVDASIIVFDIDNFKQINDQYGHVMGDEVLKALSTFCQTILRQKDKLGRYGGEEFVVVLPQANLNNAYQVAERLRTGAEALTFGDKDKPFNVTISLGVAEFNQEETMDRLIDRADDALYRAKAQGRNRTLKAE
ncbi:sensor domain-containing diguanylate cyclase [Kangiella shandongensis]|uniref:sensor domain-containing diguanylate cyclase n=1 Tax=Kangiella shandongensis TaxID=2763258 RepID=UPI001CBD01E8|nr:GGDEF domain-containing protein [Kangiella shandongensis]